MRSEKLSIPVIDTIEARHSVRTFEPRPLEAADRAKLEDYIAQVTNPFGARVDIHMLDRATSERGEKLGTYGVIKGAGTYLAVTLPAGQPRGMLAAGYQFESLLLCATAMGLGSVMLALTFNREAFTDELGLDAGTLFPVVSPVGYPAKTQTLRERAMRASLHASARKPWDSLFFDNDPSTPLTRDAAGVWARPLEMGRLAPSAGNAQPWRVVRQSDAFHLFEEHKPGLSEGEAAIKELDLGIFCAHLEQSALELGLVGRFEQASPIIPGLPATWHYHTSWVTH